MTWEMFLVSVLLCCQKNFRTYTVSADGPYRGVPLGWSDFALDKLIFFGSWLSGLQSMIE